MDPVAKRIGWARALVAAMLVVLAVVFGVGAYVGVSTVERNTAVDRFKGKVESALSKLDRNFKNMDDVMRLMAQMYTELKVDWPTAALPNFYTSAPLAKKIEEAENIALVTLVKPEDVSRYEAFMFDYWDSEPAIPPGKAGYYSEEGDRGVWARNETTNGVRESSAPYHDTTGRTTWGKNRRIGAISQVLFTDITDVPADGLGFNLYSVRKQGEAMDRLVRCVEDNSFTIATDKCGSTIQMSTSSETLDYAVKTDTQLKYVNSHRSMPVVVGDGSSHEMVGSIATQYSWITVLSRIFRDNVSGIDIVVKYRGFTFTCRIKEGVAEIIGGSEAAGYGDVASKRYAQYKVVVANALTSSQLMIETDDEYNMEMTFYPTEDFIGNYRTHLPIIIACSSVMLILLVLLVFVGYDVAVRGEAARKEIVMDTKRRFVRFVSHEIRTPMNAVRLGMTLFSTEIDGLVAKLAGKSLEEVMGVLHTTLTDWRQIAVDVLDNTVAAVDVLNDLLNYDKIESGTLRLEFSSLPIWQVIKMATRSFALQAKEKNICLSLSGAPWDAAAQELQYQALQVVGDSMRISQLLRNLMSNAIKFTPASGSISFHAEWLPEALADAQIDMTPQESQQWLSYARAGAVRVSVTDTGAGLSPEQLSEIGAEGVQFNANQLQAGQGSGLGLFISKGITQQHGGTFNVTSLGLNCGATFSILLPLFNIPPPEELSSAHLSRSSAAESSGRALGSSGTPRILVVDDANSNRKMLLRILRAKNYVCEEAENGRVAVEKYAAAAERGEPFDVILSDYEMPVMNGPDSVWEMRRMGCKCFIAGITGNVLQVDIDHFKERGADNVLAKPLDIGVFESLFRNFKPRETPYSRETSSQRVSYARETSSLRLGGGASVRFGAESARVRPALPTSPTSPTPPSAPMPPCSAPSEKVIGGSIITVSEGAGSGAGSMWAGTRTQKLTGITASEREEHPYSCLGSPLEEV